MAKLPSDFDRRLFYFELTGGTHEDENGFYQTGDLVVSKYDLAGRYGKKFRRIPLPPRTRPVVKFPEPIQDSGDVQPAITAPVAEAPSVEAIQATEEVELFSPVHGSDDDGLTRLSVQELRELATEQGIELAYDAGKAEIVEAIRYAWDAA